MSEETSPIILIIDDEEVIRHACHQVLTRLGYRVESANDGASGIKKALEIRPDLTLVDLKMPGLPGPEVLEELVRIDPYMAKVVITGYATIDTAVDCMQRGAFYFLMKPFIPDELETVTRKALEKRDKLIQEELRRDGKELKETPFAAMILQELGAPIKEIEDFFSLLETREAIGGDLVGPFLKAKESLAGLQRTARKWLS
jgi:DNA-binding NtrC family response regulator